MDYKFIESDDELRQVCDEFLKEKIIGVDLEADSLHCFKEKICLIQVATAKRAFLIDPFKIREMDPFLQVLETCKVIKIFHGSDFDVRSLDRDYNVRVNQLFDTEIACRFLGVRERGLAALLKRYFNVDMDKKYQKSDWSKRPIIKGMIEYSVGDVAYLTRLYDHICKALETNGRLVWAREEFEIQSRVRYENNHGKPLFKKFKGAGKMDRRSLGVLENLLQVRLKIAARKDRPLFKIFSAASLLTMAIEKPVTIDQLIKIHALSRKQADMYGNLCIQAVENAINLDYRDLPSYPRTCRPKKDTRVQDRIHRLKKMREKMSAATGIEPGFLLNNAVIGSIAFRAPETLEALLEIEPVRRWQVEAIGTNIISSLGY